MRLSRLLETLWFSLALILKQGSVTSSSGGAVFLLGVIVKSQPV